MTMKSSLAALLATAFAVSGCADDVAETPQGDGTETDSVGDGSATDTAADAGGTVGGTTGTGGSGEGDGDSSGGAVADESGDGDGGGNANPTSGDEGEATSGDPDPGDDGADTEMGDTGESTGGETSGGVSIDPDVVCPASCEIEVDCIDDKTFEECLADCQDDLVLDTNDGCRGPALRFLECVGTIAVCDDFMAFYDGVAPYPCESEDSLYQACLP